MEVAKNHLEIFSKHLKSYQASVNKYQSDYVGRETGALARLCIEKEMV